MDPAAPASVVVTAMMATFCVPVVVEPGLNPYQPNQRRKTPSAAMGMLWPGMARGFPSAANLPRRGPTTMAPARASQPPTEWTTVEPAKSMKPSCSSQPFDPSPWKSPPQAHLPKTG